MSLAAPAQTLAAEHAAPDRLWRWIGAMPVMGASFVSKLALPPLGAMGVSIVIPLLSAVSALGLVTGRLVVDVPRCIAYALAMATLWGSQALRGESFSVLSLLMLMVLHFPYIVRLDPLPDYRRVLDWFVKVALVLAVCGIVQFGLQFVVGPTLAFPIEKLFPAELKVAMFNPLAYLEYGSPYFRANGIFMLEPSFFSQFLAVAVVVELLMRMRWRVLALLVAAILVSYSGTGLVLIAACVPLILLARGRWDLLVGGGAAVVLALSVASATGGEFVRVFFARANEFSAPGSSGFARFIGGFYLFEQFQWQDPMRTLFGFGAGSVDGYTREANLPVSGTNILFKMVFEFGLVGAAAYFGFLACCFTRSQAPRLLKFVLVLTYALGGIYIPFSHALVFALVLWPVAGDALQEGEEGPLGAPPPAWADADDAPRGGVPA
ncbi:hypothetical protein [Pseudorhodoferax sp.]|uniref:hypothetical protein n=1 Tax=Pseudorhodoferax sp. TaxID=1993553 RepID=UPI002DD66E76|nr:hypothetical protein [Pseudorhodoferax sp.]